MISFSDIPERLLTFAVRRMPAERREWGAAMRVELSHLRSSSARWRFALDCTCVALFPPHPERSLQLVRNTTVRNFTAKPGVAAMIGVLSVVPFLILNTIVVNRIEPFFSLIRPGLHTSPQEYLLLSIVLLLMPVGAFIALRPMLRKSADGKRKIYGLNSLLSMLLLLVFVVIAVALGSDIYRCDILQIPNCD